MLLSYRYDAKKNIFTSQHGILATGCIQELPMASNLFYRVARRAAFHFVLGAMFCPFATVFFVVVVAEDELDFEGVCFVSVCVEAA
jgi:hypothetical protein